MGDTYTRQSSYTDGDVITAAHTNDEFNQLLAAFAASSGHTHDGTVAEGGPITKLLGNGLTFGAGTAGTDITITFDGETNDGVLKWMEDEDYFEFSDDILIASTEKIQFRDTAIYINSSVDGQLDIVADTEIQIAATTIDINGNVDVSGTLTVAGAVDFGDAALSNVGAVQLDSISGDADTDTSITFSGSNVITVANAGTNQVTFNDGSISPVTDSDVDLGTTSLRFKDVYIDSATVTGEVAAASLDISGNIDVDGITNLDVVDIDGAVDMASTLAVAGVLTGASLDISGDIDIDGTANLDIVDIDGAVDMATTLTVAGNVDFNGDLDVDGTTNLDVVDIDGAVDMASTLAVAGVLTGASLDISGDIDVDGTTNLDNTDIDGTLVVDGSNISLDSTSTLNIDNSNTTNGITIGTATSGVPVSIGHTTSETTVNDNLTVTGDFTVNGTTTTVATTNMVVADNLIELNNGATSNANDSGIVIERGSTGDNAIFMWDESADTFVLGTTTATGASTGSLSVTDGALQAGSLDISGDIDVDGTLEADAITLNGTALGSLYSPIAGGSGIVTTGALNSGSITSGFGTIDNGASAITTTGVITGGTLEATTDTAAGDNAAIGYTAAEGLILTGQGSTSDITLKNDADAVVFTVPTGTLALQLSLIHI